MINFDGIGNDRRIPLIEVEFNNSMAVTGTPAQRQCVLLFGQARMKENAVDGAGVLDVQAERNCHDNGDNSHEDHVPGHFVFHERRMLL